MSKRFFTGSVAAVLSVLLFHAANNVFFLSRHPLAEGKDSYAHLNAFMKLSQVLRYGQERFFCDLRQSRLEKLIFIEPDYPPFFYACSVAMDIVLGRCIAYAALFTNTISFMLVLLAVYGIGRRFNEETGAIAATLCSLYPLMFITSRHFTLEPMLAAMVALSMWLLLKTECFEQLPWAVLLGIVMGLGMLTKQTFALYAAGPLAMILAGCRTFTEKNRWKCLPNMLWCIVITASISALYYSNKLVYNNAVNRAHFDGAVAQASWWSFKHLLYYPCSFANTIGPVFFGLFIVAVLRLPLLPPLLRSMLVSWIVVPVLVLSGINLKYGEYTIPLLPAVALCTAAGITTIKNRKIRAAIVMIIVCVGMYRYFPRTYESKKLFSSYSLQFVKLEKTADCQGDNATERSFISVVREIGAVPARVGIISDVLDSSFPGYFARAYCAWSEKKAAVMNFTVCMTGFFAALETFDIIIYITRSDRKWPEQEGFRDFIEEWNAKCFTKIRVVEATAKPRLAAECVLGKSEIIIPADLLGRLVALNNDYTLQYELIHADENITVPEHVLVYRRKQ